MKRYVSFLLLMGLFWFVILFSSRTVYAQDTIRVEDQELAEKYSPVLYFHPSELFRPQSVDVLVNTSRLREERNMWFDINLLNKVSISDLRTYREKRYILDVWYGSDGASDLMNYSAHRSYYEKALRPEVGGPPVVTYAHVVRDQSEGTITIQYWLFYYYNDWFNKHEGDWEMVQVMLAETGEPQWVVFSQHHGGTRRAWKATRIESGTHPVVFVALGSHANYFSDDEVYPNGQDIGNARVEIVDRTGSSGRIMPDVILIPNRDELDKFLHLWPNLEWLTFGGHWGELALQGDFGGPLGPADKGEQWEQPYDWGIAQPLDVNVWYRNRMRVEVLGEAANLASVSLRDADGNVLASSESLGNLALLHRDPSTDSVITADIEIPHTSTISIVASLPDVHKFQVTSYLFEDINVSSPADYSLIIEPGAQPSLWISGENTKIKPTISETRSETWDAPDLIWVAGHLPASDVVRGVSISLLAGLIPTFVYLGLLYWSDRYEKEPLTLLSAALLWGAIPALLVAVTFRIFFRLPFELLGPKAVEAVRIGVLTPFVEEFLKGVIILFIAWRYRLEFDNVHDGIIYGAMVGFGFSMTGNVISYLGAFFLRGFAGLSSMIFVEGVLFGLNHALYSAIFGAGVGYARLEKDRDKRVIVALIAFLLAVFANATHTLAIQSFIGFTLFSVVITWIGLFGTGALILWSLKRQERTLKVELVGELPDAFYEEVISQRLRRRNLWRALRSEGYLGWQNLRYKYQQCAELAFKKMQSRRFPEDTDVHAEMLRLQKLVHKLVFEE